MQNFEIACVNRFVFITNTRFQRTSLTTLMIFKIRKLFFQRCEFSERTLFIHDLLIYVLVWRGAVKNWMKCQLTHDVLSLATAWPLSETSRKVNRQFADVQFRQHYHASSGLSKIKAKLGWVRRNIHYYIYNIHTGCVKSNLGI